MHRALLLLIAGALTVHAQEPEVDTYRFREGGSRVVSVVIEAAGARFELDIVAGADHFFDGAPDVEAIFERAVRFLLDLATACGRARPA